MHECPETPTCSKCRVELTDANWFPSRKRQGARICKRCVHLGSEPSPQFRNSIDPQRYRDAHRDWVNRTKTRARQLLGGICQLCSAGEDLHFAHVAYGAKNPHRSALQTAREVIKHPDRFLLLCRDCHFHPEKYLKELLEQRRAEKGQQCMSA